MTTSGVSAEADVLMFSDKLTYIFADFNDLFVRPGLLNAPFSLADFHDVVIGHGSLPLDLLERRADAYIAAVLARLQGS